MGILEAVLLGVIQGVTEFLPVSSSGHLVLFQRIFGISEPALLFDTMVHVGTLAAVFVVLRKDILDILRRPFQALTGFLILATLPAVIAALLFNDAIERAFQFGSFLGFAFLLTSLALLVSEFLAKRSGHDQEAPEIKPAMDCLDALIIGVLQAAAIIPGVSRSGFTLSGALSRRLDRDFAARFSFLLSIPAILGALVFQLKDLAGGSAGQAGDMAAGTVSGGIGAGAILAGSLSAAVVGFFSVRLMLKIIRKRSLAGFAVYTAVLGTLVLIDRYGTHFFF
ncbi:MAG: undecaprenyl-diphosphate phosphatase [Treponema sp.]|nr:undecaprenyl-diphosphate phosphatase [Treponema sp.]